VLKEVKVLKGRKVLKEP
jgi:hypothetical protein